MLKPPRHEPPINRKHNPLALSQCLAKTLGEETGKREPGLDVETHCKVVGAVAKELMARIPDHLREALFPAGSELVAACHDVGKVNPHFQEKLRRSLDSYRRNSHPGLEYANPDVEVSVGWHAGVGQAALSGTGRYIPEIVGCHHGKPADPRAIKLPHDEILGGPEWQAIREELVSRLQSFFQAEWPQIKDHLGALAVSGLTTVADWIGSGPLFDTRTALDADEIARCARVAVDRAGFIRPSVKPGLAFKDLFPSYAPLPMQSQLCAMVQEPGVYILEDQMGQGKTEAALAAAYQLLQRGLATGIYFALPTQLTSGKIHERIERFLDAILADDEIHRAGLLHGKSWMYETDLGEEGRPGYSWFNARKRGLLAPFAVGTIDQALMAVMNVKHGFVRTFGLVGKVVILDEVHTYDAYTGTIMDHLIHSLRDLGCTVIVLSATLTAQRKKQMLSNTRKDIDTSTPAHYPLITAVSTTTNPRFSRSCDVAESLVHVITDAAEDDALMEAQKRASDGQRVLWIENTVPKAQQIYRLLGAWAAENEVETAVLHSRFTALDRQRLDEKWVNIFGKVRGDAGNSGGKILVGTQVLEQSLDIDADFLVSRAAPSDMLLQRIGRLWRHRQNDALRPEGSRPEVWLLWPRPEVVADDPAEAFGTDGVVYAPYVLARTFEVWRNMTKIVIPTDMRSIIEQTYQARIESSSSMSRLEHELQQAKGKLQRFAMVSMAQVGQTWTDDALTRHSELPGRELLLLKKGLRPGSSEVKLADGYTIQIPPAVSLGMQERKKISRELQLRMLTVHAYQAPQPPSVKELDWLKPFLYLGDGSESLVSVAIVKESGSIVGMNGGDAHEKYELGYSPVLGFTTKTK